MRSYFRNLLLQFRSLFSCTLVAFACFLAPHSASAQATSAAYPTAQPAPEWDDPSIEPRVEELLKKMTLEEKVGQLVQYSAGQPTGPGTGRTDYNDTLQIFQSIQLHQHLAYYSLRHVSITSF